MTEQAKYFIRIILVPLGFLFLCAPAAAQSPQVQVMQLNQQAMDLYGNLEIEQSLALLKQAEEICTKNQLTGGAVARTYINMGMVEYGGLGNNAGAMDFFKKALCHDPGVMLDPLNSTPDMDILFTGAKNQVNASGCAGIGPSTQTTPAVTQPAQPAAVTGGLVTNDVLRHPAVTQQKRMVPIPFYVQTNPAKDVQQVVLYYRTIGERIFQQMPLSNNGQAWVGTIGCDVLTVLDPTGLDYYIAALDSTNQLLATAGSEAQPFQISVVDIVTTPPPPPPGEAAPEACREECPPWDPGCNENCVQYADVCSDAEPCCKGLVCMDGVCEEGEEEGGDGDDGSDIKHHARIFLNGGTGFGLVGPGTYDQGDFPNMIYTGSIDTKVGIALSKLHVRLGAMFALPVDKLEVGLNGRFDLPLSPDYPPIAVSVIANVSYRIVGDNKAKGFQMLAVAGFGWMNIMHRIPFDDCATVNVDDGQCADPAGWYLNADDIIKRNGFRRSGFLGVELGLDMYYWLHKNVGLNLGAIFDIAFPVFALNLDVQAGVAFRF